MALNRYVLRSTLVGALGGLLFGFDTAVISGTTAALTHVYHLSPAQLGFTVSIALWGTVIGSIGAGSLGQRYGSREIPTTRTTCCRRRCYVRTVSFINSRPEPIVARGDRRTVEQDQRIGQRGARRELLR